jgi:hypothetical protein
MMNKQLQELPKLNLDPCMATSKLSTIAPVDLSRNRDSLDYTQLNGSMFATAIKDKADGSRPIVEDVIFATLDLADLKVGKSLLEIRHCRNRQDRQKPYYSTSIANKSSEKIRIDRFGTYIPKGKTLVLHSITGGFFSSQQFQEWYDLGQSLWIEPDQIVTDPNNHSNIGVYWAYFGATASGHQFVAGSAWNGRSWWQLW